MARVVFLHKLPTAFVVVGRGFSGTGHGERRIMPYQLFADKSGDRPLKVGLFENEVAAESFCAKKGWSMHSVDLDPAAVIRIVPGGKVKAKTDVKWGWECSECDCHNTKRPAFRHIDSYGRGKNRKLPADKQAIKESLPPGSSGNVCTACFHPSMNHSYAGR